MFLHGSDLSGDVHGSDSAGETFPESASLDMINSDCADTLNLVDILDGETKGLVNGPRRKFEIVEGLEDAGSLEPGHVLDEITVTRGVSDGEYALF